MRYCNASNRSHEVFANGWKVNMNTYHRNHAHRRLAAWLPQRMLAALLWSAALLGLAAIPVSAVETIADSAGPRSANADVGELLGLPEQPPVPYPGEFPAVCVWTMCTETDGTEYWVSCNETCGANDIPGNNVWLLQPGRSPSTNSSGLMCMQPCMVSDDDHVWVPCTVDCWEKHEPRED